MLELETERKFENCGMFFDGRIRPTNVEDGGSVSTKHFDVGGPFSNTGFWSERLNISACEVLCDV